MQLFIDNYHLKFPTVDKKEDQVGVSGNRRGTRLSSMDVRNENTTPNYWENGLPGPQGIESDPTQLPHTT